MIFGKATESRKKRESVVEEGITISPLPLTEGEMLSISYDGLLAKSGANQVFAHIGFGSNEEWQNVQDIQMENGKGKWDCSLIPLDSRLNFCFHDTANNWDNNNGHNWSLTIHNGEK